MLRDRMLAASLSRRATAAAIRGEILTVAAITQPRFPAGTAGQAGGLVPWFPEPGSTFFRIHVPVSMQAEAAWLPAAKATIHHSYGDADHWRQESGLGAKPDVV